MSQPSSSVTMYYLRKIVVAGLIIIAVVWIATPFVISILYAFSSTEDYYNFRLVIPLTYTFEHVKALIDLGAGEYIMNSIIVALMTIGISFLLGLPAGYAFAKYVFPGKDPLKLFIVGLRMFPILVIAVPLVTLYIKLGLNDTLLGVALAHTAMALPFVVLITSSIFAGIPKDIEEAGLIFGLSRVGVFFRITLPMALPGLAAAAIFTFIMSWNEVFIASVLTFQHRTLPAFILTAAQASPDTIKFAAGFIMILPAMIFVFIARKYLVAMWGITLR